jgi:hypothetical protein
LQAYVTTSALISGSVWPLEGAFVLEAISSSILQEILFAVLLAEFAILGRAVPEPKASDRTS